MSKEIKPKKRRSSTKKSTSELEAKIEELEAKLGQLSSQVKPAEARETQHARPAPPPAPKPRQAASGPTHGTLPAGMAPPKPKEAPKPTTSSSVSSGEVAPAYATISSTGYTGNKYFATRARLSYHPPDKQFKGESAAAQIVRVAPELPKPKRGTMPSGWKP